MASLHAAGYCPTVACKFLATASCFGRWAARSGVAPAEFTTATLEAFHQHLRRCRCRDCARARGPHVSVAIRRFLGYLRRAGVAALTPCPLATPVGSPLSAAFGTWMEHHRGVSAATCETYGRLVATLLRAVGDDPAQFTPAGLRACVLAFGGRHGRHHTKLFVTASRMFLRYLVILGQCPASLVDAIPTVADWRLASLPRYLSPADVARLVGACDPTTPRGARDRAIVLLLSRLGLRAGEVATLRFVDLDWQGATLRVVGKGRRAARLPLPQDVGDAILEYLHRGRPRYDDDHIFLRVIAPHGPLRRTAISDVVDRAIRRAGVAAPTHGAHLLRHSAAVDLLRQGSSLDAIAVVLPSRR